MKMHENAMRPIHKNIVKRQNVGELTIQKRRVRAGKNKGFEFTDLLLVRKSNVLLIRMGCALTLVVKQQSQDGFVVGKQITTTKQASFVASFATTATRL